MPIFGYKAINRDGKNVKGTIDAVSEKQAVAKLQGQNLYVASIKVMKEKTGSPKGKGFQFGKKIPSTEITGFIRQFSVLASTGIPYDKAFEILLQECQNAGFRAILADMRSQIMEGSSLANTMQNFPHIFTRMHVAMVRSGETGGTLPDVLKRMADSREADEALKSKIQGAMVYPVIMVIVAILIVIFMLTFILPKIVPVFQQFNVELPLPTRIVIFLSDVLTQHWLVISLAVIISVFMFRKAKHTAKGELLMDRLILKIPIFGNVIEKIIICRFTQTLGTMLSSGVELRSTLKVIKHVVGNRVYEDIFDQMSKDITEKGLDLSYVLRKTGLFPPTVTQLVRVGEESSQLESMLNKISEILDREIKQTLEKTIALLEPVTILWMAVVVGFILLAVMMPMFEINNMI